jgi:RHS repeat-associated protein
MLQPGRSFSNGNQYRYGFNGKENDNDVKGIEGSQQDYGMRIYYPRVGRFLSVDPLAKRFPHFSSYQYAGNTPIQAVDLDGGEPIRPKSLVYNKNDLGFIDRTLSRHSWNYYVYVPAESSDGNSSVITVATTYAVEWQYNKFWGESSETYIHNDDLVWVEYKGTFYNMTDCANQTISEKDFQNKQTWSQYWESMQNFQDGLNNISEKAAMAVAAGQIVGGLAAAATAIRISKLFNSSVENKLTKYLLNPNYPGGASKAKWFKEALGFTKNNWKDLAKQIVFDAKNAVSKGNTKGYGEMFEQMIEITGANGKKISVQFNFIKREGEDFVRLVGAIPPKK